LDKFSIYRVKSRGCTIATNKLHGMGQGVDTLPEVCELYPVWTGDDATGLKRAEQVAWRVEDGIAGAQIPLDERLGSERDLAARFGTGLGVAREALEILDVRGVCIVRRGPGGGIFVSKPSTETTAQAITNYLLRLALTPRQIQEAEQLLLELDAKQRAENPVMILFAECLDQIKSSLAEHQDRDAKARSASWLLRESSAIGAGTWRCDPMRSLSVAQRVGWAISIAIAKGHFAGCRRLGSEEQLCESYQVSRASMRQATRLLETCGIIESRPGPQGGLIPCQPSTASIIRRIDSYLLALRLNGLAWRDAAQLFGDAALNSLLSNAGEGEQSFLEEGLETMACLKREHRLPVARRLLREMIERCRNPLITVFWRALAGYIFRAFIKSCDPDISEIADFTVNVPQIFEAAVANDGVSVGRIYRAIYSEELARAWTH
jgi:DNA-binding FadR family transcriptional regulator